MQHTVGSGAHAKTSSFSDSGLRLRQLKRAGLERAESMLATAHISRPFEPPAPAPGLFADARQPSPAPSSRAT